MFLSYILIYHGLATSLLHSNSMCMHTAWSYRQIDLTYLISVHVWHACESYFNTCIIHHYLENGTVWHGTSHTSESLLPVQVSQAWNPARARTQGSNSTPSAPRPCGHAMRMSMADLCSPGAGARAKRLTTGMDPAWKQQQT